MASENWNKNSKSPGIENGGLLNDMPNKIG